MIKTIIFDIGGTLIKSKDIFQEIANKFENEDKEKILALIKEKFFKIYAEQPNQEFRTVVELIKQALKEVSEELNLKDISDSTGEFYENTFVNHSSLYEDTLPLLIQLKKMGIKLVVLSDADAYVLHKELDLFDIRKYFDKIFISSEIGAYKPSDISVKMALAECEGPVSEVLFIGDAKADLLTAKKMGAKFVLINREGKFFEGPDYKINSLDKLKDIIKKN